MAWLLEHPDVCMSDSDTISSFDALSDSDSTSEDAEEASNSFTHVVSDASKSTENLRCCISQAV